MNNRRQPLVLRLCLWLVRICSTLVPSRDRRDWRMEWEGELHHRQDYLQARNRFDRRHQVDLLRRALGAFPDAAWIRRQLTLDADLVHDVRHGLRMLWKSPGFTVSAVFILAVGIGSTVAVLTLLDTLMFRPLPYDESSRIVTLWQQRAAGSGEREDVAPANFLDWRERAQSFSHLAAAVPYSYDATGGAEPLTLFAAQVTDGFWNAVGMPPALGRAFLPEEHVRGARRVVIISHRMWQQRLSGNPAAIGTTLSMDGEAYTVVGILPPGFAPQLLPRPDALDVFTPKVVQEHEKRTRGSAWWNVVGRLKPGVTIEQAQAELARISAELAAEHPRTNTGVTAVAVPLREHLMGDVQAPLLVMLGAVVLVLGIGCANVASLLLARGMSRAREFAIRSAMGAGRGRLVRQLVTESLLLSGIAAAAGIALAHWAVQLIVSLAPGGVLRLQEASIDGRALVLAAVLTTLTAVAFGLLPALQFSRPERDAMRDRTGSAPRRTFRRGLVAAEVAFALVLLTGAGLLIRSFDRLTSVDPGFSPADVVSLQVFAHDRHPTDDQVRAFFTATLDRLRALPGVASVGAVSAMPFAMANIDVKSPLEVVGRPTSPDQPVTYVTVATPGYFRTLSIPLRAGRLLDDRDTSRTSTVAVISEALRRREWPSGDPVGERLAVQWEGQRLEAEIVGVVSQIRHDSLDSAARPEVFFALDQVPFASITYVVRGSGEPGALIKAAQREIWAVDPLQTFYDTASVEGLLDASVVRQRFSMTLMSAFALVALILCAIGIYGVISFTTTQRTREIGVRMALGADASAIQRMVLREGAMVVGAGVVAGLAGAMIAARFIQAMLFETAPGDPLTVGAVSVLIAVVGLAASYIPARRATRVEPVAALRD